MARSKEEGGVPSVSAGGDTYHCLEEKSRTRDACSSKGQACRRGGSRGSRKGSPGRRGRGYEKGGGAETGSIHEAWLEGPRRGVREEMDEGAGAWNALI